MVGHRRYVIDIPGSVHGVSTRQQAFGALGQYGYRAALANGRLVQLWPRAFVDADKLLDLHARAAAALLTAGREAVISGLTAARLHGLTAAPNGPVHVLIPYNRWVRPHDGLKVHHGRFGVDDVVELDGLRVLALDLVISQLLCSADRRVAVACADQAVGRQPAEDRDEFVEAIEHRLSSRTDRRGTRQAEALLAIVDGGAESPSESMLRLLVVDHGFALPNVQHQVCDLDGTVRYRLDLAWPQLRIALEYDGYEAHLDRELADAARDEDLSRRGWLVLRVKAADLRDSRRLLDELRKAFARRGGYPIAVRVAI